MESCPHAERLALDRNIDGSPTAPAREARCMSEDEGRKADEVEGGCGNSF